MNLSENERIDDLQYKGLKLIQNKNGFCFGIDAVLLANFAKNMKKCETVVDLCTGNGIVAVLLSGKTSASKIYGVEIQEDVAALAKRNVELNGLGNRVEILNENLTRLKAHIPSATVDSVTVNPPYMKAGSGVINDENTLIIARHEISCTLEDVIKEAARLLKFNGEFFMIHKPERLVEIFCMMRKYKIEPKRIRFVQPSANKPANLVLIEGSKNAGEFLKVETPLCVYNENGEYTSEIYDIYEMKDKR